MKKHPKTAGDAPCFCERCKRPLRVAEHRRADSKPFRLAKEPKGVCPDCVMTAFLYNTYPINMQIDQAGPDLLLKPGICEAFAACGLLDDCDLKIEEVNWRRVVDNWNLPIQVDKKDPRNPYRMGDARRQTEARREAGLSLDGDAIAASFGELMADPKKRLM